MTALGILLVSMSVGFIVWSFIAEWFIEPFLARQSRRDELILLILPHGFRYVGLSFLLPGVVASDLSPLFSHPAAYGDMLTTVLALVALTALRFRWVFAMELVWIFNVVGLLDLCWALYRGLAHVHPGQFQAAFFIPTVAVPLLIVTHVMIFQRLLRPAP
jgi:hypothetical protein